MMGRDLGRKLNVARDGAERVAGAGVQKRVSRTRKKKRGKKNLSTFPPPAAETFSHNLTLVRSQGTSSSSTGTDNTSSPPSLFLRPSLTTPLSPLKTGFDHRYYILVRTYTYASSIQFTHYRPFTRIQHVCVGGVGIITSLWPFIPPDP